MNKKHVITLVLTTLLIMSVLGCAGLCLSAGECFDDAIADELDDRDGDDE